MEIVHVYDGHEKVYNGRGSVPGVVWHLARETAKADHNVTIVERQWDGLNAQANHEDVVFRRLNLRTGADEPWTRVPYEQINSPSSLTRLIGDRINFAVQALGKLRHQSFDVLHVHLPFAANVMMTLAPWLRDRTVYTAHLGELRLNALESEDDNQSEGEAIKMEGGGDHTNKTTEPVNVPGIIQRFSPDIFLTKRVAHTTVLNPTIREQFVERSVGTNSISVIPNGVDIDRFANVDPNRVESVCEQYSLEDTRIVLFVGTVMPRKGVTDLIEAFADVVSVAEDDVRLVLAGEYDLDEAYKKTVESRIDDLGLNRHIDRLGFVDEADLPGLYSAADVCVVPSHEEGFGMTAIEAMAAGTPVVGTRVGGLPQIIDDGFNGYLVDVNDVDRLGDEISKTLAGNSSKEMGSNAAERAQKYSWEGVTKEFRKIYENL
jgi:glycosyltransferase involved in cell wall biosynthesis